MTIDGNAGYALTPTDFIIAVAVLAAFAILAWQVSSLLLRRGVKPRHISLLDKKLSRLEDSLRDKHPDDPRL
ncbi:MULTISPECIES: hypothetical protein [unclassified Brevundimonas]|uniref:hypothetical protein n=1 Tax=unclassified Brevundimonas TaxID=2622653 RepID=UPI000CFD3491|nr:MULTISPECIES: hypothetical protein [unclassified Brevundimonas]PRA30886.1 hypothetical protein CQ024_07240 [Brevundimonas sp. MYb27]PQZ82857.1 hypothetical protein CQ026_07640 [Brevundimonas sp. MYb31]PRB16747.1 hypothetical protein CQ039_03570 [Brevundimonas sp. MYb52]PRB34716.1 hypothetical protein CQ035_10160 [Brevundimonas sp. MYb46]PRB54717.1 hypothetical protein CQ028_04055 [Brevundimonas sp. MYb33]